MRARHASRSVTVVLLALNLPACVSATRTADDDGGEGTAGQSDARADTRITGSDRQCDNSEVRQETIGSCDGDTGGGDLADLIDVGVDAAGHHDAGVVVVGDVSVDGEGKRWDAGHSRDAVPDIIVVDVATEDAALSDGMVDSTNDAVKDVDTAEANGGDTTNVEDIEALSGIDASDGDGDGETANWPPPGTDLTPYVCGKVEGGAPELPDYDPCIGEPLAPVVALVATACPDLPQKSAIVLGVVNLDAWFMTWHVDLGDWALAVGIYDLVAASVDSVVVVAKGSPGAELYQQNKLQLTVAAEVQASGDVLWTTELTGWPPTSGLVAERAGPGAYVMGAGTLDQQDGIWSLDSLGGTQTAAVLTSLEKWGYIEGSATAGSGLGAVFAGSQHATAVPCAEQRVFLVDQSGKLEWARHYDVGVNSSSGVGGTSRVASVGDCGYALGVWGSVLPAAHVLRLDPEGRVVARWRWSFGLDTPTSDLHLAANADLLVLVVNRWYKPDFGGSLPYVLRVSPQTGAVKSLHTMEETATSYSPQDVLVLDSGVIIVAGGGYFTGEARLTVLGPEGCPVAHYGLGDALGGLDLPLTSVQNLVYLGGARFAVTDMTYHSLVGIRSSRIYFVELPAVAELEAQISGQTSPP